ncbi:MAG: hypothetical protein J6A15_09240 [Clostridia bacterium]|nr:hypothetical protein [Clostridia bacterium]
MKNKIEIIDTILNNSDAFDTYIQSIEKENIKTPISLQDKILSSISKEPKKKKNLKFVDILKIAACTILSVLLWNSMNKIPLTPKEETNEDKSYMLINTSDLSKKINQFMFKPIEIERGEK